MKYRYWLFKLKLLIIYGISVFVFTFNYNQHYNSFVSSVGLNCANESLQALGKVGVLIFEGNRCQFSEWSTFLMVYGTSLLGIILILFSIVSFIKSRNKKCVNNVFLNNKYYLWTILLSIFTLILIIFPEFFYFKDIYLDFFRANTLFKLGYNSFILGSVISAVGVYVFYRWIIQRNFFANIFILVVSLIVLLLSSYTPIGIYQNAYKDRLARESLDGTIWVDRINSGKKELIDYIQKNIASSPTIAEAYSDSYQAGGLISAYTGLPTVIQWSGHQKMWRGYNVDIDQRKQDLKVLYTSNSEADVMKIIKKYNIKYVIISDDERKQYKNIGVVSKIKNAKAVYIDKVNDIVLLDTRELLKS